MVSHAFHSHRIDGMLDGFAAVAATMPAGRLTIPVVSNVDGGLHRETIDPSYWIRHARAPVRFADGLGTALGLGVDAVIEVGPQPVLIGLLPKATSEAGAARSGRSASVGP
ncbi:MAG: hypothetical protein ABIN08_11840, partial [Caldimonas sp.]